MSNQRFSPEFKDEAVRHIVDRGYSVPEVSERLGVSAHSLYKWVKAVKPDKTDEQASALIEARSEVIAYSTPKQEKWLHCNHAELDVRFAAAVGAVFDFFAGRVRRSHPVFQRLGLEWLPRLVQEPHRLWRRMGVSAPIFLWHVLREKAKR
jgi:exopolysaccharide biosynthesis WecB/TagA/CpsF family protein